MAYTADYDLLTLNAAQWKVIENMVSVLAPFEEFTMEVSSLKSSAADIISSRENLTQTME